MSYRQVSVVFCISSLTGAEHLTRRIRTWMHVSERCMTAHLSPLTIDPHSCMQLSLAATKGQSNPFKAEMGSGVRYVSARVANAPREVYVFMRSWRSLGYVSVARSVPSAAKAPSQNEK
jgi:hypothetical protein